MEKRADLISYLGSPAQVGLGCVSLVDSRGRGLPGLEGEVRVCGGGGGQGGRGPRKAGRAPPTVGGAGGAWRRAGRTVPAGSE